MDGFSISLFKASPSINSPDSIPSHLVKNIALSVVLFLFCIISFSSTDHFNQYVNMLFFFALKKKPKQLDSPLLFILAVIPFPYSCLQQNWKELSVLSVSNFSFAVVFEATLMWFLVPATPLKLLSSFISMLPSPVVSCQSSFLTFQ